MRSVAESTITAPPRVQPVVFVLGAILPNTFPGWAASGAELFFARSFLRAANPATASPISISDDGSGVELHQRWAPNIVTTLGRLGGRCSRYR